VTSLLGREIAGKFMSDKKAVARVKEIIAGKKFYQVNLDLPRFLKKSGACVHMKVTKSSNVGTFLLGAGKGSAHDISMSHGFLNYELR
jgi:hypothetical protein